MKGRLVGAIAIALLLVLVFAVAAQAAVPQSTINAIIKDAQDGTIDGNWSAAQIQATLDYIKDNPTYQMYSDLEGVLTDYLSSLQAPGSQSGQLAFTGSDMILVLGAGLGLMGGGLALRRRRHA